MRWFVAIFQDFVQKCRGQRSCCIAGPGLTVSRRHSKLALSFSDPPLRYTYVIGSVTQHNFPGGVAC